MPSLTEMGIPTHQQLVIPAIRAVEDGGGSAKSKEIVDHVVENFPNSENLVPITYPNRPNKSVLVDRAEWGRSTAKRIGALEQPSRGIYISTTLGKRLLTLSSDEAFQLIQDLDREYNRKLRSSTHKENPRAPFLDEDENPSEKRFSAEPDDDEDFESGWKEQLLNRLHKMTPEGFEKFVLFLLKRYDLELTHVGGSGDEGIDGIGLAPLSPVLSSRVAVQIKRYDPNGKPIGRETVALFQRDAQTKGAERAILVTLSRFTEPARKASMSATPTVDLIDGARLAGLVKEAGDLGVSLQPTVDERWYDQFD